jgi:TolB-like protein/Flp pilus assembly protein TadD
VTSPQEPGVPAAAATAGSQQQAAGQPARAIFLSYASADAAAALRIASALRGAGLEVWLDQSELRGGDAWDQSIRDQIGACALFIPIISANAHARLEGYFRLEWKLAIDRSHRMAHKQSFLLPVVIDDTRRSDDTIPPRFRELQWTRLANGETPAEFIAHIKRLLASEPARAADLTLADTPPARRAWRLVLLLAALLAVGLSVLFGTKLISGRSSVAYPLDAANERASTRLSAFAPPPHSIAVLPFVTMSGDKEQEYFSDGLAEELLNDLARIDELKVAARTSAFSFKGKDVDIGTIAHKLNVGAVLEGSVRRSGHTVRVTAQLINSVTGFHLWSQTYDRDLGDVLKLQTEIAEAVVSALKVTLLGNTVAKLQLGGTTNPAAFDAYLRAVTAHRQANGVAEYQAAVALFTQAIKEDPHYALAFARRSLSLTTLASLFATLETRGQTFAQAKADAHRAIALAPDLAEGYSALGLFMELTLDFAGAKAQYERAYQLGPGSSTVLATYSRIPIFMGHGYDDAALGAMRRAVERDPLGAGVHYELADRLYFSRRYAEAIAAYQASLSLQANQPSAYGQIGLSYYLLGDLQNARRSCAKNSDDWQMRLCLVVTLHKLGLSTEAEALITKLREQLGDAGAFQFAEIYAQGDDHEKALAWLDTAVRLQDPGLSEVRADPLLDPLRDEPRFQAIQRALKFPD